ncbi:flavin-containing monooxygenase [Rhodococcus pyridinivorans]|uniref:flavin-containing monooxygenase n=1 Tax=Rhodococcus pyridinivorans TaxID=103816 RepID=UPI000BA1E4D7|nr:NAD(P)-binding domain-containing protein [Rhodococcus pyridinivorans]
MTDYDALVIGGGQSGLAAAHALSTRGLRTGLLEAGDEPVGAWPHYYDSLTLFSPAKYSALPGLAFPGDPQRYPRRDEVIDYLRRYAAGLDVDIVTGSRVETVTCERGVYTAHPAVGGSVTAPILIAATGYFGSPNMPPLPGLDTFGGTVLHTGDYRDPAALTGQNVVVVGAGNSAVQIATELAEVATVTLASRRPPKFLLQRIFGRDVHFWLTVTGVDRAPLGPWLPASPTQQVLDTGRYRRALASGNPQPRPLFTGLDDRRVFWPDGAATTVDTVLLGTGYRPHLPYLTGLGALDETGRPWHRQGLSTTHLGLGYVGLEWQRSLSSASLRGVGRDAGRVADRVVAAARSRRALPTGL